MMCNFVFRDSAASFDDVSQRFGLNIPASFRETRGKVGGAERGSNDLLYHEH